MNNDSSDAEAQKSPDVKERRKSKPRYHMPAERIRYWNRISPSGAVNDLWAMLKWDSPYRIRFLALAGALTICILGGFLGQASNFRIEPRSYQVDYVDLPPIDETLRQKEARYEQNRLERDAEFERNREQAEKIKKFYRDLAEASGVDVDDDEDANGGKVVDPE